MKTLKLLMAAALIFVSATSWAAMPQQGTVELSGALGGRFLEDAHNMIVLSARMDIYYTDFLLIGARIESGFGADTAHTGAAEALYLFPIDDISAVYTGVTAGVGIVDIDNDSDLEFIVSGVVGYKNYIQPGLAIYSELELGTIAGDNSENFMGINVGVSMPF